MSDLSIGDVSPACDLRRMDTNPGTPADTDDPFDYGSDADPDQEAVARAFAELDKLTLQAERATEARKKAEDALQKLKQAEERLLNKEIPDLLEKMRLEKCTTASGIEVTVRREIRASLPGMERVDDRSRAFAWLLEGGNGGVIKNKIVVDLDRGHDDRAAELAVELRSRGFDPQSYRDVHAQTLSALIRELIAAGKIVPRDCFNIFDDRKAKLSRRDA